MVRTESEYVREDIKQYDEENQHDISDNLKVYAEKSEKAVSTIAERDYHGD